MTSKLAILCGGWLAACVPVAAAPDGPTVDAGGTDAVNGVTTVNLTMSYPSYDQVNGQYVCSTGVMQPINVFVPAGPPGTKLPLLLFFPGTLATATSGLSPDLVERAAHFGFVAAALEYHSYDVLLWPDRMDAKERCVFDSDISSSDNAIDQLCGNQGPLATSNVQVDCSRGIVVSGHSQGGGMALMARNYDSRVRAAYVIDAVAAYDASSSCTNFLDPMYDVACNMFTAGFPYLADPTMVTAQVGTFTGPAYGSANYRVLPSSAVITEAGDADPYFTPHGATVVASGDVAARLDNITGGTCGAGASCTAPSGSGWFEVDAAAQLDVAAEVAPFAGAGHCWFSDGNSPDCTSGTYVPDAHYFAKGSTDGWTLEPIVRWLAGFTT